MQVGLETSYGESILADNNSVQNQTARMGEGKPACGKCRSTGRRCDGYGILKNAGNAKNGVTFSSAFTLANLFLNFPGTRQEHRYPAFFIGRTAPALSGTFESRFWKAFLPQVGTSEPTIQHAMMAVAALHERFEMSGDVILDPKTMCRRFAIQQYNKAISCSTKRLSKGPQSEEVTLMCCVLFISLEYLRGNVISSVNFLRSGKGILVTWKDLKQYHIDEAQGLGSHPTSSQLISRRYLHESPCYLCYAAMIPPRTSQPLQRLKP